jgi:hypothetical protein
MPRSSRREGSTNSRNSRRGLLESIRAARTTEVDREEPPEGIRRNGRLWTLEGVAGSNRERREDEGRPFPYGEEGGQIAQEATSAPLSEVGRANEALDELERLTARIRRHFPTVFELGYASTRRGLREGSRTGTSDPTLAVIEDPGKDRARAAVRKADVSLRAAKRLLEEADRTLANVISREIRTTAEGLCSVCRRRPATRKGKCATCYQYERRRGSERPVELVDRQEQREVV